MSATLRKTEAGMFVVRLIFVLRHAVQLYASRPKKAYIPKVRHCQPFASLYWPGDRMVFIQVR